MTQDNLSYVIQLSNVVIDNCKIDSFDLVQGDWVYIHGENNACKKSLYKFITCQVSGAGEKAVFDKENLFDIPSEKVQEIRRKIAFVESHFSFKSEADILNHLERLGKGREHFNILNSYFKETGSEETSKIISNIKMALAINPLVLIIDHSFDSLTKDEMSRLIEALIAYKQDFPLALIINTNNEYLTSNYLGRSYQVNGSHLIELDV